METSKKLTEVLRLKITYTSPLPLSDFGTSLVALDRLYRDYIKERDTNGQLRDTCICISQVQKGCMEIDFVALIDGINYVMSPEHSSIIESNIRYFAMWLRGKISNWRQITKDTPENTRNFLQILKPGVMMEFIKLVNGKNEGSVFKISSDDIDNEMEI
jgi:hypothetical protein